jgi:hypothetical protein
VLDWVQNGEPAKDDLPKLIRIFYASDSLVSEA